MLVISHRGYAPTPNARAAAQSDPRPVAQNTIEAFDQAVRLGVDGIETDVRLDADGRAVLMHDRLLPDGRPVAALDHREMEQAVGHPVALLEDVLQRFDVLWNLEIKDAAALATVVAAVRRFADRRRFLVTSFRHDVIAQLAGQLEVDLGLLVTGRPIDLAAAILEPWKHHARVRSIVWDYDFVDPPLLREATARGWRNTVFTVNASQEIEQCRQWGIDAVITDFPQRAISTPQNRQ